MPRTSVEIQPPSTASVRTWRATTAVRVFALALSAGQALGSGGLGDSAALLFTVAMIALVTTVLEGTLNGRRSPWIPVVEGILVATLLTTSLPVQALLVYLAVPPLVAGLRHGWVTTINTALGTAAAVLASSLGYRDLGVDAGRLAISYPWIAIGLGAGVLAAWQSRSVRHLEIRQAPYATAHHLLDQLHTLTRQGRVGLDSPAVASELARTIAHQARAVGATVLLRSADGGLVPCVRLGNTEGLVDFASSGDALRRTVAEGERAAFPLRAQDKVFGVLALCNERGWVAGQLRALQLSLDTRALRLETALLFDDVRQLATADERSRLAREIHDGIAQEIVALGYLVDEVEHYVGEPTGLDVAARLRTEIGRVIAELRFSVYDLRHDVAGRDFAAALSEYIREVRAGSDLRVHLTIDDESVRLPSRTEAELLRIAKEAIGNARKHARAINLWVTFKTTGHGISLVIEDDGVGAAAPKDSHFGMHTMRERAQKIGAELTVAERRDGGTIVSLRSTPSPRSGGDLRHEHASPASR